ncbi:hypothetical protein [Paenibacillus eucommiae]|uniref:Uncharacterized protein n=1 Tax=Paenibacillus eucommiae TaxID=1355755 RepID=A0ABS4IY68_9BACL|nr:hypothetical protein [Paenibacillus eucommiae]MBP1992532.1 hypothetical protein [Paenibacillus eucommiae]
MISDRALQMIEQKLTPIIKSGKRIDSIKLMVCPVSPIAKAAIIETRFGPLRVVPGEYLKMGFSYLIESPISRGGIGFNWVSKKVKTSDEGIVGNGK